MSIQGTGSVETYGFERQLLDAWGSWARGGTALSYSKLYLWNKAGGGYIFPERDLLIADSAIAALPIAHKKTLKKVYIHRKGLKVDGNRKQAAVAAFSESLARASKELRESPAIN